MSRGWSATTQWSLVLAAGDSRNPQSAEALSTLCQTYWYPVYAFVRGRGHRADVAEDLTQGFFTQFLEKNYIRQVDPDRGRFRSFLLVSVKNFLANEWDRQRAEKRGGGIPPLSLDFEAAESRYGLEPADTATPEKIFDRRWALTQLDKVLSSLRAEMVQVGMSDRFESLHGYLTGEGSGVPYEQIAGELGISEGAVKVAVHRMRRRFGELLRQAVAETVDNPDRIDSEIRDLFESMQP